MITVLSLHGYDWTYSGPDLLHFDSAFDPVGRKKLSATTPHPPFLSLLSLAHCKCVCFHFTLSLSKCSIVLFMPPGALTVLLLSKSRARPS